MCHVIKKLLGNKNKIDYGNNITKSGSGKGYLEINYVKTHLILFLIIKELLGIISKYYKMNFSELIQTR